MSEICGSKIDRLIVSIKTSCKQQTAKVSPLKEIHMFQKNYKQFHTNTDTLLSRSGDLVRVMDIKYKHECAKSQICFLDCDFEPKDARPLDQKAQTSKQLILDDFFQFFSQDCNLYSTIQDEQSQCLNIKRRFKPNTCSTNPGFWIFFPPNALYGNSSNYLNFFFQNI